MYRNNNIRYRQTVSIASPRTLRKIQTVVWSLKLLLDTSSNNAIRASHATVWTYLFWVYEKGWTDHYDHSNRKSTDSHKPEDKPFAILSYIWSRCVFVVPTVCSWQLLCQYSYISSVTLHEISNLPTVSFLVVDLQDDRTPRATNTWRNSR